ARSMRRNSGRSTPRAVSTKRKAIQSSQARMTRGAADEGPERALVLRHAHRCGTASSLRHCYLSSVSDAIECQGEQVEGRAGHPAGKNRPPPREEQATPQGRTGHPAGKNRPRLVRSPVTSRV